MRQYVSPGRLISVLVTDETMSCVFWKLHHSRTVPAIKVMGIRPPQQKILVESLLCLSEPVFGCLVSPPYNFFIKTVRPFQPVVRDLMRE